MVTYQPPMAFDLRAECAKCGREADVPSGGGRHPIRGDGYLVINGDGPCPQCGSERLKVRFTIDESERPEEERPR